MDKYIHIFIHISINMDKNIEIIIHILINMDKYIHINIYSNNKEKGVHQWLWRS
jgi:hypothetical protein